MTVRRMNGADTSPLLRGKDPVERLRQWLNVQVRLIRWQWGLPLMTQKRTLAILRLSPHSPTGAPPNAALALPSRLLLEGSWSVVSPPFLPPMLLATVASWNATRPARWPLAGFQGCDVLRLGL